VKQRHFGQPDTDAQTAGADLALLHALIGHYARQLWDVQRARLALSHRAAALKRDGVPEQWHLPMLVAATDLAATEHAIGLELTRLARQHFLSGWIQEAPGIGLGGFARLLGVTGPLERFATVSKLWAYMGLHVVDGAAPRSRRGRPARWSAQGRVICHQIGVAIVRLGAGRYRVAYDRKKAEYLARPRRGPSACPFEQVHRTTKGAVVLCGLKHADNAARRYAVKALLRDMWEAWHALAPSSGEAAVIGLECANT
jgi:hypothetical protein